MKDKIIKDVEHRIGFTSGITNYYNQYLETYRSKRTRIRRSLANFVTLFLINEHPTSYIEAIYSKEAKICKEPIDKELESILPTRLEFGRLN